MFVKKRSFAPAAAVLAGVVGAVPLFGLAVLRSWNGPFPIPPAEAPAEVRAEPVVGLDSVPDRFLPGDALSSVLVRNGFSGPEVAGVVAALDGFADVRSFRVGQTVWMHRDPRGAPARVELPLGDFRRVTVVRDAAGWGAREETAEPFARRAVVRGTVESSLYESLVGAGELPGLAVLLASALEYDIDFHRDSRRGDTWSVVVDKLFSPEGEWKGYGPLRAVRYVNRGRPISAFRFELPDGGAGYYDRDGNSIKRAFLMSPVAYSRISGVFTHRRLHPVLGVYRPHYGVDYAAPTGSPVMATADGVVVDAGMRGPNGNMVTLRHAGGYMTRYLHLSRFSAAAKPGQRVEQRQVIGYVGSTGLSSGPHLDYRLYRYGKPLDPRSQIIPPGPPIPEEHLPAFRAWREGLERALDDGPKPPRSREAVAAAAIAGS